MAGPSSQQVMACSQEVMAIPEYVFKLLTFCADKNHSKITIYETPYESLDFSPVFWDNGL
jgi:hypothetical protein